MPVSEKPLHDKRQNYSQYSIEKINTIKNYGPWGSTDFLALWCLSPRCCSAFICRQTWVKEQVSQEEMAGSSDAELGESVLQSLFFVTNFLKWVASGRTKPLLDRDHRSSLLEGMD